MQIRTLCIFVSVIVCRFSFVANTGCTVYPFEVNLHPLIVISGKNDFLYPKWGEDVLKFTPGQSIDIICPERDILVGSFKLKTSLLTASCIGRTVFEINNTQINWRDLRCSGYHWKTIKYTNDTCARGAGKEIEIGFSIGNNRFLRFLLICFNHVNEIAYYSYINQTTSINQRIAGTPRPSWLQGFGFYSVGKVTNLYLRYKQRETINRLLGLPTNSTKYIQHNNNFFLARGHLTARSDGFYAAQQNATFFMQNVAPQWQTFNGFNWKQVEIDVRDYAEQHGADLQIWTGVHGVSTLPHEETGEDIELYLYVTETVKALPVPELFWKVVYDPESKNGVAILGVNNPYLEEFDPVCDDVSDELTWFHCKKDNQIRGFCYACSIASFRKIVKVLPDFGVSGLLL